MGDTEEQIKENYSKNLKAMDYANWVHQGLELDSNLHRFPLTFLYEMLHSGKLKGSKMLEIGSGVLVHYVAVASAFFPNIIMSDYVEDNCEELKRWLDGKSSVKQFLDIPAELEGFEKDLESGKKLIINRIIKSVKQVVRCDVLNDDIFLEDVKQDVAPPYDLITSALCLASSVPDFDGLVLSLKRINKLLRVGGSLFLVGFLKGKTWGVAETLFHYLEVSEEDLRNALKKSGFVNVDMRLHGKLNFGYGHDDYYCLVAEKIE